jgi:hypothetical protein
VRALSKSDLATVIAAFPDGVEVESIAGVMGRSRETARQTLESALIKTRCGFAILRLAPPDEANRLLAELARRRRELRVEDFKAIVKRLRRERAA